MREMKNSGVEWIGNIPSTWNVCKIKNVANLYTGNSIKDEEKQNYEENKNAHPYISSKDIDAVFQTIDYDNGMYVQDNDESFKTAVSGDILMCIEGGSAGKKKAILNRTVSFVNKLCCISPTSINSRYLFYHLMSPNFEMEFNKNLSGLIGGVSVTNLSNISLQLPHFTEQTLIANFLDKKVSAIDNVIAKTKESIEEYKKLKQSIITEAVTKGLNLDVEMKDSGVEWIGSIPFNWETIKIKYTSWLKGRIGWDGLKSTEFIDEGPYLITGTDFNNGFVDWNTCVHITEERFAEDILLHIKEDDLLITKDGTVGKLAIAKNCPKKVSLNSGVLLIRNDRNFKYNAKFLYYILSSNQFKLWYELSNVGNSTIKHLYQEQFYNFEFSYPSFEEQSEIAAYLDKSLGFVDSMIEKSNNLLKEYESYKKSLIYEYVTGKKEVDKFC